MIREEFYHREHRARPGEKKVKVCKIPRTLSFLLGALGVLGVLGGKILLFLSSPSVCSVVKLFSYRPEKS